MKDSVEKKKTRIKEEYVASWSPVFPDTSVSSSSGHYIHLIEFNFLKSTTCVM